MIGLFRRIFGQGQASWETAIVGAGLGPPLVITLYTGLGVLEAVSENAHPWKIENLVAGLLFGGTLIAWLGAFLLGLPLWALLKWLKFERGIVFGLVGFVAAFSMTRNGSEFLFSSQLGRYAAGLLGFLVAIACWLIASSPRWQEESE